MEGAHANVGMGHRFLRHIERTSLLLFVVDVCGFQLSSRHPHREAWETVELLVAELEAYQCGLSERVAVLAVNKMDSVGADRKLDTLIKQLSKCPKMFAGVVPMSALYKTGVDDLKLLLADLLQTDRHTT